MLSFLTEFRASNAAEVRRTAPGDLSKSKRWLRPVCAFWKKLEDSILQGSCGGAFFKGGNPLLRNRNRFRKFYNLKHFLFLEFRLMAGKIGAKSPLPGTVHKMQPYGLPIRAGGGFRRP
ncbi:MAG: hypothetical protein EBS01_01140 [Verrucomicrobia bacterium]|nr:hypothetical protein [Verrucomicrobiota bacterium]